LQHGHNIKWTCYDDACAGYDIEDAIVMNRASLDRGFGRCIVIKKSQAVLRKYANRTQDRVVAPAAGEQSRA
jgi:DNA-directed RNA polymerase III subunit RPC2